MAKDDCVPRRVRVAVSTSWVARPPFDLHLLRGAPAVSGV